MTIRILLGDCRKVLSTLPEQSVQCCVTSPPYYGLRDYGVNGQIGLEQTLDQYVDQLVDVFRAVRRVLRDDGVLWLNLGDSYGRNPAKGQHKPGDSGKQGYVYDRGGGRASSTLLGGGVKEKDLAGIPWTVALALRADGWYLRSAVVWHKPNSLPEPVKDRPASAYEMVFLLSKSPVYYYDAGAIAEPTVSGARRTARNVWTIATKPLKGAHFAAFPPLLAEKCVMAGSAVGDTVLDPFGGAGTTGLVANRAGRNAVLVELNPDYIEITRRRFDLSADLVLPGIASALARFSAAAAELTKALES